MGDFFSNWAANNAGKWACPTCATYVEDDVLICPCCETKNPNPKAPAANAATSTAAPAAPASASFSFGFGAATPAPATNAAAPIPTFGFGIPAAAPAAASAAVPTFGFSLAPSAAPAPATTAPATFTFGAPAPADSAPVAPTFTFGLPAAAAVPSVAGAPNATVPSIETAASSVMATAAASSKAVASSTSSAAAAGLSSPGGTMLTGLSQVWKKYNDPTASWTCPACMVPSAVSVERCSCCDNPNPHFKASAAAANPAGAATPIPAAPSSSAAPASAAFQWGMPAAAPGPAPAAAATFTFGAPAAPAASAQSAAAFVWGQPPVAAAPAVPAASAPVPAPKQQQVVPTATPAAAPAAPAAAASNPNTSEPRDLFSKERAAASSFAKPSWPGAAGSGSGVLLAGPPAVAYEQYSAITSSSAAAAKSSTGAGASAASSSSSLPRFLFTWGSGECEQLGHGDEEYSLELPRMLKGLARVPIARIAVGGLHTLALTIDGRVWSWGCNDDNALGRVGAENKPGRVRGLLNDSVVSRIACGDSHSIAVDEAGRVFAWGTYKGADGYLGFDAKTKKQVEPRFMQDVWVQFGPAAEVSCGADHTGVVTVHGQGVTWGYNGQGQLGKPYVERGLRGGREVFLQLAPHPIHIKKPRGLAEEADVPPATAASSASSAAAGSSAAPAAGKKRGRGADSITSSSSAAAVSAADSASSGSGAYPAPGRGRVPKTEETITGLFCVGYSTFITTAGAGQRVYACGLNSYGQLGTGNTANLTSPVLIDALSGRGVCSVVGGSQHTVALTNDGCVFAFGRADSGQLGISGDTERRSKIPVGASAFAPVQIDPKRFAGTAVVQISANGCTSAAVTATGSLYSWGFGESGQLGNSGAGDENYPFLVNKADKGGDLKGLMVHSAGMGGQHMVVLGGPRPGQAMSAALSIKDGAKVFDVVEDPLRDEGADADFEDDGGERLPTEDGGNGGNGDDDDNDDDSDLDVGSGDEGNYQGGEDEGFAPEGAGMCSDSDDDDDGGGAGAGASKKKAKRG